MRPDAHLGLELDAVLIHSPPGPLVVDPLPAPLVLSPLRAVVSPPVEVGDVVVVAEGVVAGTHATVLTTGATTAVLPPLLLLLLLLLALVVGGCGGGRCARRCRLIVRAAPLVGVGAVAAAAVEARWRAAEGAPPSTQAGSWTAARAVVGALRMGR